MKSILLLVWLLTLPVGVVAAAPSPPTRQLVEIRVDRSQTMPFSPAIFGFNTQNQNAVYSYADPALRSLVDDLRPTQLRFPGGTVANFYHFASDGFIEAELKGTRDKKLNQRLASNYRRLMKKHGGKLNFKAFMKLCREQRIRPVLVANLYTGSPEESAAWVRMVKKEGFEVEGWELGNELYLPAYRKRFPDAGAYLAEARRHAAAMRAVDPNIRLSVVAAPIGFHLERKNAQAGFEKDWNRVVGAGDVGEAASIHLYTYAMVRRNPPFEVMRGYLFGSSKIGLDQALTYYQKTFPGKRFWVTEWNIANPRNRFLNTQLHALYVGDFMLGLLQHSPQVTAANFHVLAGRGKGWPLLSPAEAGEKGGGADVRRLVFKVFSLIGDGLTGADKQWSTEIVGAPQIEAKLKFSGEQLSGMRAVALNSSSGTVLLLCNRTADALPVRLVMDGKDWNGTLEYRYLAGDVDATNGGNNLLKADPARPLELSQWRGAAASLVVPGNSFGFLRLQERGAGQP